MRHLPASAGQSSGAATPPNARITTSRRSAQHWALASRGARTAKNHRSVLSRFHNLYILAVNPTCFFTDINELSAMLAARDESATRKAQGE
jgi:hypothetical protein